MVDFNDADLHPMEHPEPSYKRVPLIRVPAHLFDAGVGDFEWQQCGRDQARFPQTPGNCWSVRLSEQ